MHLPPIKSPYYEDDWSATNDGVDTQIKTDAYTAGTVL